jgi:hypothetical protein
MVWWQWILILALIVLVVWYAMQKKAGKM